jgi:uncharacterized protein DUF3500
MSTFSRRTLIAGGAASLVTAPLPSVQAQTDSASVAELADAIGTSASAFLNALSDAETGIATYAFDDPERLFWHWTSTTGVARKGLRIGDMNEPTRESALALLRSSVSEAGYEKSLNIMALQEDLGRDPGEFYVTVFGSPGDSEPWGWRFEGHHLSLHLTVDGEQVVGYPFFLGAWPTEAASGLRAMDREEAAGRELTLSLVPERQAVAIFEAEALGTHVTQNAASVEPLEPVGIQVSEFNEGQHALFEEIIQTYLGTLPEALAAPALAEIAEAGTAAITFGWPGSLEPLQRHYYRIQGPSFLLEFDNSRNGATHIHSVWRNFANDFGGYR